VLNSRGIPSGDVVSLETALTSTQVQHRQVIAEVDQPGIGKVKIFNMTAKFSKTPAQIEMPPPRLSENTQVILGELGYGAEEMKALKEKFVI
jgi:crotonobetainyl-CoA:carnitine CoA-transferase CaiB-like acyl-CoA transferase